MKAVKGNRVYKVDENSKEDYRRRGFDIVDDKGKIVAYGAGKKVSIEKYVKLEEENKELKAELAKIKKSKKTEE